MDPLALLLDSLDVTLPVFVMVFVGYLLRRTRMVDHRFVTTASHLVFHGSMPVMIFLSIIAADLDATLNPRMLGFFAIATLASFLLSWGWAHRRVAVADRSACIQGAFRGNCGIVGLALAAGMYGDAGLSTGGLLLGVVILTYNAFSVIALTHYQAGHHGAWRNVLGHILRNPLILAVLTALPLAAMNLSLPGWLEASGSYFASLTLPLALLCVGATLSLRALKRSGWITVETSLIKMVAIPVLATGSAWLVGFEGRELGVMFLFFASPTAAAAFVMAKAMGGNAVLTANIIALTTLMASVTITLGAFGLQMIGVI
uniref:AEC family transporter n=1 Tax=Halomonas sp. TaxID=1486246 RepID=UPI002626A2EB|nr:AEC family transporter [Halomonas sp.]